MNAKSTLARIVAATAVALVAGLAHAESPTVVADESLSLKSRTEVQAEVLQAAQAGTLIGAGEYVAVYTPANDNQVSVARETTRLEAASANATIASLYLAG